MRITKLLTIVLISALGFGQNDPSNVNFTDIVPPAPSVSALMKLEEVPVNYYTGTPDISIPLYGEKLHERLDLNVGLNYSSTGIKVDDIPGWAGAGWALNFGGSISRTMIGRPDDDMNGIFNNGFFTYESMGDEEKQIFLWNANRFRKDTEYDLFQYNFMGRTGRFYLHKDPLTGQIRPYDLDGNASHKIILNIDTINNKVIDFTIIDQYGYQYLFNAKDYTTSISQPQALEPYDQYVSAWHLTAVKSSSNDILCQFYYDTAIENSITPTNVTYNNLISEYTGIIDANTGSTPSYLPATVFSFSTTTMESSVINRIETKKSKIYFEREARVQGSSSFQNAYVGHKLKRIIIKDLLDNEIKRYDFLINTSVSEKIFLEKIITRFPNETDTHDYLLSYYNQGNLPKFNSKDKDFWGYYNNSNNTTLNPFLGANRNVNKQAIKTGVLTSIKYPTGGSKVFDFEPNTYSYVGSDLLDPNNADDIPENLTYTFKSWNIASTQVNNNNKIVYFEGNQMIATTFKAVSFNSSFRDDIKGYKLLVIPVTPNSYIDPNGGITEFDPNSFSDDDLTATNARISYAINIEDCGNVQTINECLKNLVLTGWYNFKLVQDNQLAMFPVTYSVFFNYKRLSGTNKSTLGGGLRIKKIQFSEDNKNYIETLYSYNLASDASLSSGSQLQKPKKEPYIITRDLKYYIPSNGGTTLGVVFDATTYLVYDNQSSLTIASDKGAYVGYKNVKAEKVITTYTTNRVGDLIELHTPILGKEEYVFTSPIDFPDYPSNTPWVYPFATKPSFDYKRGLLLESRVYDNSDTLLQKEINVYNYYDTAINLGFSLKERASFDCPFVSEYTSYSAFKAFLLRMYYELNNRQVPGQQIWDNYFNQGDVLTGGNGWILCAKATRYLESIPNIQIVGRAELVQKESIRYFKENGTSTTPFVSQNSFFTYNAINKEIKSQSTTNSNNQTIETKYSYAHEMGNQALIDKNMIAIPLKTEVKRSGIALSSQETQYKDWGNGLLAPEIIKTAKGAATAEDRIKYNALDNTTGNPQEVQQEGGQPITYIWGYNKTLPIAKIENATYAQVQPYEANLQTLSNGTDEASLITALNSLRTVLPNAMITTYTHKPLIGVSTMTDSKGNFVRYHYDPFNRLEFVTDKDDKVVSENKYHYKN